MTWLAKFRSAPPLPPVNDDAQEAAEYYQRAKEALGEAERRREEVHQVASDLAVLRARNHFGQSFERAMTRKAKTA